jgi:hypothetical protein
MLSLVEEGGQPSDAARHGQEMLRLLKESQAAYADTANQLEALGPEGQAQAARVRSCMTDLSALQRNTQAVVTPLTQGQHPSLETGFELMNTMNRAFSNGVNTAFTTFTTHPQMERLRIGRISPTPPTPR